MLYYVRCCSRRPLLQHFTGLVIHEGSKTLVEVPMSEEKKERLRSQKDFEVHHDVVLEALVACFYIMINFIVAEDDLVLSYEVKSLSL